MSTSTIRANRQNSYFTLWANQTSAPEKKSVVLDFSIDDITLDKKNSFSNVLYFFSHTEIVNTVVHDILPAGNLTLTFSLTGKYASHFSLLRGLFAFGKLTGLSIQSEAANKAFQIEVTPGHSENAILYFKNIFSQLMREVRFKSALNGVLLAQQEAVRIQQASLVNLAKSLQYFEESPLTVVLSPSKKIYQ